MKNAGADRSNRPGTTAAYPGDDPAVIDALAGRCVHNLRRRKGLSRSALGAAAGVTGQQIDKYERGLNRMSLSRFSRIAEALGTDPISLLARAQEHGEATVPAPQQGHSATTASHRLKAAELMRLGLDMPEPLLDHLLALGKATRR